MDIFLKVGMELRGILLISVSAMIVVSVLSFLNCSTANYECFQSVNYT